MKKKTVLLVAMLFSFYLNAQEIGHYPLLNECLEQQLNFDKSNNPSTIQYVYLEDSPLAYSEGKNEFFDLKLKEVDGISIEYLSRKELNEKGKKGVNVLNVYPFRLGDDGRFYLLVEEVYIKRRNYQVIGQTSYKFRFDCKTQKFVIDEVVRHYL